MAARPASALWLLRRVGVRGATVTGGVALGAVILLVVALFGGAGGIGDQPDPDPEAGSRPGPMTAIQPELRRALLTDRDLPVTVTTPPGDAARAGSPTTAPPPPPPAAGPAAGVDAPTPEEEPCRTLFEDPSRLSGLWPVVNPRETTSRHTTRQGGSVLQQVLSVFDDDAAAAAYSRLREAAGRCDEFAAFLDGNPVLVLLQEVSGQPEAGLSHRTEPGHEAYAMSITVRGESSSHTGWLALDRVGPVVLVLRQLGPDGAPVDNQEEIRRSALSKLRPVLRLLDHR